MFLGRGEADEGHSNGHEGALAHRITYFPYPAPSDPSIARYIAKGDTSRSLPKEVPYSFFIGQLPHLLPLPYVAWSLDFLMEEYGTKWILQTHKNGCAKGWAESAAQLELLLGPLNGRLLFDVCGVWVARSDEEKRILDDYLRVIQETNTSVDVRIPRTAINLEPLKSQVRKQDQQAQFQLQQQQQQQPRQLYPQAQPHYGPQRHQPHHNANHGWSGAMPPPPPPPAHPGPEYGYYRGY